MQGIDVIGASSSNTSDEWIAVVSGLDIGSLSPADAQIQMLVEYLTGEAGGPDDQTLVSQISRLIIAGNAFAPLGLGENDADDKKPVSMIVVVFICDAHLLAL